MINLNNMFLKLSRNTDARDFDSHTSDLEKISRNVLKLEDKTYFSHQGMLIVNTKSCD